MIQSFTIAGRLPGMNEVVGANRSNPHVGAKLKRDADKTVAAYIKAARVRPITRPVVVDCYWYEPNRRRDPDNVRSAVKFILDALQQTGVLQGDGHRHVAGFRDHFGFDSDDPRIVVTLEEV